MLRKFYHSLLLFSFLSASAAATGRIDLSWSPNQEADLVGYNVYRSVDGSGQFVRLNEMLVETTAYSDDGLEPDHTYHYVVTAVNSSGIESPYSDEVSRTISDNSAPIAMDDHASTTEGMVVTIVVLDNDSDPDGDPLEVTGFIYTGTETVELLSDQSFEYTPSTGFNGTDAFTYTLSDGQGGTDTGTVTVDVAESNSSPVAMADSAVTKGRKPVTIDVLANDSDPDGDQLVLVEVTSPSHGRITLNEDNTLTYQADVHFRGTDFFTYTISDGRGGTASAPVEIEVTK